MSSTTHCHTKMLLSELRWIEGANILLTHIGDGQRSLPPAVGLSCVPLPSQQKAATLRLLAALGTINAVRRCKHGQRQAWTQALHYACLRLRFPRARKTSHVHGACIASSSSSPASAYYGYCVISCAIVSTTGEEDSSKVPRMNIASRFSGPNDTEKRHFMKERGRLLYQASYIFLPGIFATCSSRRLACWGLHLFF